MTEILPKNATITDLQAFYSDELAKYSKLSARFDSGCATINDLMFFASLLKNLLRLDSLTGLPNELGAMEFTDKLLSEDNDVVLFKLDIAGFKKVNATFSHAEGDRVLAEMAQILTNIFRGYNYLCTRMQGDEFIIILPLARNTVGNGKHVDLNPATKDATVLTEILNAVNIKIKAIFDKNSPADERLADKYLNLSLSHILEVSTSFYCADSVNNGPLSFNDLYTSTKPVTYAIDETEVGEPKSPNLGDEGIDRSDDYRLADFAEVSRKVLGESIINHSTKLSKRAAELITEITTLEQEIATVELTAEDKKFKYTQLIAKYKKAFNIDLMSGLYNKHFVQSRIAKIIAERDKDGSYLGYGYVGMCDLQGFGAINIANASEEDDTIGRKIGDSVLKEFSQIFYGKAKILENLLNELTDIDLPVTVDVARSGGDEFHIIINGPRSLQELDIEKLINEVIINPAKQEIVIFCQKEGIKYPRPGIHFGGTAVRKEKTPDEVMRSAEVVKERNKIKKIIGQSSTLLSRFGNFARRIFGI